MWISLTFQTFADPINKHKSKKSKAAPVEPVPQLHADHHDDLNAGHGYDSYDTDEYTDHLTGKPDFWTNSHNPHSGMGQKVVDAFSAIGDFILRTPKLQDN